MLVGRGLLTLDGPVDQYRLFPVVSPAFTNVPITLRPLATHPFSIRGNDFCLSHYYSLQSGQDVKEPLAVEDRPAFIPADAAVSRVVFLQNILTPTGKWWQPKDFFARRPGKLSGYPNVVAPL